MAGQEAALAAAAAAVGARRFFSCQYYHVSSCFSLANIKVHCRRQDAAHCAGTWAKVCPKASSETRTTRLDEAPTRLAPMAPSAPPRHRAATANGQHCSLGAQLNRCARTSS